MTLEVSDTIGFCTFYGPQTATRCCVITIQKKLVYFRFGYVDINSLIKCIECPRQPPDVVLSHFNLKQ